jgi:DNA-directed RNA polymerase subunit RPC12/RpoP
LSGEIHGGLKHSGLTPDAMASSHLIVAEGAGGHGVLELLENAPAIFASSARILYLSSSHYDGLYSRFFESGIPVQAFASLPELLGSLRDALASALMGLRIYVTGTESFMSDVAIVAHGYGVSYESIRMEHRGSQSRRVQCVHCKKITEDVASNLVSCLHCGLRLFVRNHYSRRIGAFLGVAANVEDPSDPVSATEVYS